MSLFLPAAFPFEQDSTRGDLASFQDSSVSPKKREMEALGVDKTPPKTTPSQRATTPPPAPTSPPSNTGKKRKASPSPRAPITARDAKRPKATRDDADADERLRQASREEEKSRGRRLFGGLLSTLAGGGGSAQLQQRRRREIERRQLDKIQKQTVEGDKLRAEKREALNQVRLEKQIIWEEQVMQCRHAKDLKLAQYLRTRCSPEIYFLPWKLTRDEEDTIADQVRACKSRIASELEDFRTRQEQHRRRLAPPTTATTTTAEEDGQPEDGGSDAKEQYPPVAAGVKEQAEASPPKARSKASPDAEAHQDHDDSGDILVEADEDMVIY
ncbi:Pinin/SDK/MemA protein [Ophiocordyceps camponoti-floridani]|uniref:Pinin/SDK/MemA protein n=1 Tax=Ophiocordyceps camponoti-floridani TaxID=2030778 RepID=A0A8H4Q1E0_9HYPO|nr:Pinin/SDK/MemA protein [Ophiocordyceps camponoti-floridani]